MGEPRKPCPIEINGQWIIRGAKCIYPHIEFPPSEEQGIQEISLYHVGLGRIILIECLPPWDVSHFIEDEDAFSLALGGLDDSLLTGFMIQSTLLSFWVRLNYSKKMTYSPGSWKVGGRKSYSSDSYLLFCLSSPRLNFFRFLLSMSFLHS